MENQIQNLSDVIAYAVINDRDNLLQFIQSQGIPIDKKTILDTDITYIIVNSISENASFLENFQKWLSTKMPSNFSNSDGGADGFGGSSTSSSGGSFWGGSTFGSITGLVSSGLGLFGSLAMSKEQRKAAEAAANAQISASQSNAQSNMTQLQIAQTMLEAEKIKASNPQKMNTGLVIGLVVVGFVVLGGVIFAVTRKN